MQSGQTSSRCPAFSSLRELLGRWHQRRSLLLLYLEIPSDNKKFDWTPWITTNLYQERQTQFPRFCSNIESLRGTCDWSCYRRLSVGPFHEFSAESWSDLSDQCRELFLPLLPYSFRSTERYPLRQFVSLFTFVLHLLIYITIISWIYPPTQEGSKWRFSLWSPITNKFNIPVPLTPGKGEGGVELKIMG